MNEKDSIIKEWIFKADHDLGTAKVVFQYIPEYSDIIAFHCQQAVEKYIKSALIFNDIQFKFSHNLIYLLDLLSIKKEISEIIYEKAIKLNGFSVEFRYPNSKISLSEAELKLAIQITEEFRKFILTIVTIE